MRTTRVCLTLSGFLACSCLFAAQAAHAQSPRKPGLYEVTSTMSMGGSSMPNGAQMPQMPAGQQMPQNIQLPPGVQLPPGMQMPQMPQSGQMSGGNPMAAPHTIQICVTQAQIDKYGGPSPAPPHGECQISNISMKPNGMKATISCTGQMTATGTVETTYNADGSSKSTEHLTGTMGASSHQMDVTIQSTSVYKGPDCGNVKPMQMPATK
jgi:hypothetical protein